MRGSTELGSYVLSMQCSLSVLGQEVGLSVEGMASVAIGSHVAAVRLEYIGVGAIAAIDGQDVQKPPLQLGIFHRKESFHAAVQVAAHQIGASQIQQLLAAVAEIIDTAVLQEAAQQRGDLDALADSGHHGAQAAEAAYHELYAHAGARCAVERGDELGVF